MSSLVISGDTSGAVTLAAPAVAGTTTITMPAVSGTMTVLSATQSMVRLNTANGWGSTNTKIRRYTNTVTNQGTDITYADSATLGASFTINTTGVYGIAITETTSSAFTHAITLNDTTPTVNVGNQAAGEILVALSMTANNIASCGGTFFLLAGSVIRSHGEGAGAGSSPQFVQFIITRVA